MLKASSTYNLLPRKISGEPKNNEGDSFIFLIVNQLQNTLKMRIVIFLKKGYPE